MFDTQQFKDKEHWNVDFGAIKYQMDQRGCDTSTIPSWISAPILSARDFPKRWRRWIRC